jgi:hypothetical protein
MAQPDPEVDIALLLMDEKQTGGQIFLATRNGRSGIFCGPWKHRGAMRQGYLAPAELEFAKILKTACLW